MIRKYIVKIGKESYEVEVDEIQRQAPAAPAFSNIIMPQVVTTPLAVPSAAKPPMRKKSENGKTVDAMMSGSIIAIMVKEGDAVKEGDQVIKLEAMKMETVVTSPYAGKVKEIVVKERQAVQAGETLIVME